MNFKLPITPLVVAATLACAPVFAREKPTLREAAGDKFLVGAAIATVDLQDPKLSALVTQQFNCITPEYDFMPEKLIDEKGNFTFENGDKIVDFAEKNSMPVFGHMLVWHFVTRKWLFENPDGTPLPREKALANLKLYIDGVVGHYQGRIKAWDVVNEAISDNADEYLKDTPALRAIGPDYIEKAFEFAHDADPNVELYYNDYNIEQPGKLEKTLRLIRALQAKKLRIDAVGAGARSLAAELAAAGDDRKRCSGSCCDWCESDGDRTRCRSAAARRQRRRYGAGRKWCQSIPR